MKSSILMIIFNKNQFLVSLHLINSVDADLFSIVLHTPFRDLNVQVPLPLYLSWGFGNLSSTLGLKKITVIPRVVEMLYFVSLHDIKI